MHEGSNLISYEMRLKSHHQTLIGNPSPNIHRVDQSITHAWIDTSPNIHHVWKLVTKHSIEMNIGKTHHESFYGNDIGNP